MLISIYLRTMGWKWTGDELQASDTFLVDVDYFFRKNEIFQVYNYYIQLDRKLYAV